MPAGSHGARTRIFERAHSHNELTLHYGVGAVQEKVEEGSGEVAKPGFSQTIVTRWAKACEHEDCGGASAEHTVVCEQRPIAARRSDRLAFARRSRLVVGNSG